MTKLRDVAKERHVLFLEEVKRLEESIELKMEDLKSDMSKGMEKIELNYSSLRSKVNVLAEVVKNHVEYNTLFLTKLEAKTETNSKIFDKIEEFLESLKECSTKLDLFQQTFVSLDSISKIVSSF